MISYNAWQNFTESKYNYSNLKEQLSFPSKIFIYNSMYIYIYICMYVCMYVYAHIFPKLKMVKIISATSSNLGYGVTNGFHTFMLSDDDAIWDNHTSQAAFLRQNSLHMDFFWPYWRSNKD